jgi:hypothetical protein
MGRRCPGHVNTGAVHKDVEPAETRDDLPPRARFGLIVEVRARRYAIPLAGRVLAVACACCAWLEAPMATRAPSAANALTMAAPMPLEPPVT